MPTQYGSVDAIAVESSVANRLISAYSFLLRIIILQVWTLIVLAGVFLSLKVKKPTHNSTMIMAGIWNANSPASVLKLSAKYFWKLKSLDLLPWILVAMIIVVVGYAVPIQIAPYIIIGHAAPVAPSAIYVPGLLDEKNASNEELLEDYVLKVAAALRATAIVQSTNQTIGDLVSVDELETLKYLPNEERLARIGYRYSVSGLDFGLQHYPDLFLHVEGSCVTEYGWVESGENRTEIYYLWNNRTDRDMKMTVAPMTDGRRPLVFFQANNFSSENTGTNTSFAAVISSSYRLSYFSSIDPWYLTFDSHNHTPWYIVKPGRPALSCWQNDVWSYRGHNSSYDTLDKLPGLQMSKTPLAVFLRFLSTPMIITLATNLGASALQSSLTTLGPILDGSSASIHSDLERLVLASYVATKNVLTETTLFPTTSIPNMVEDSNGETLSGVAEFVIRSSNVSTLSIKVLIVVPVISVVLLLIVFFVKNLQSPWYKVHALQATVLYSCLDEMTMSAHEKRMWQRDSNMVFWEGDAEHGCVGPRYGWKSDRKLDWRRHESRDNLG